MFNRGIPYLVDQHLSIYHLTCQWQWRKNFCDFFLCFIFGVGFWTPKRKLDSGNIFGLFFLFWVLSLPVGSRGCRRGVLDLAFGIS